MRKIYIFLILTLFFSKLKESIVVICSENIKDLMSGLILLSNNFDSLEINAIHVKSQLAYKGLKDDIKHYI
jgi:hypothetical protein